MDRFTSAIEAQIKEAQKRGDFDHLPGKGKPIDNLHQHDPDWWIKGKMKDEQLEGIPLIPSLSLRKQVRETLARIDAIEDHALVRRALSDLNQDIRKGNSQQTKGPSSNVMPIDIERYLRER